MPTKPRKIRSIDGLEDVPLPGHYDCITTQLNITTYANNMNARLVIVSRFPTTQIELGRDFTEIGDADHVWDAARQGLTKHQREVYYLMAGRQSPR